MECVTDLRGFVAESADVIRSRHEAAGEFDAEASKFERYRKTIYGKERISDPSWDSRGRAR